MKVIARVLHFRGDERCRLTRRQAIYLMLYTAGLVVVSVIIHEGAHIIAAMTFGASFSELRLGFLGVNPSVTLPVWLTGRSLTTVYYAGGLTAGALFLIPYLLYWMPVYRRNPAFFTWSLGLVTAVMAAIQFACGYLEGRHHNAYIAGGISFSITDVVIYGWAFAAGLIHWKLCPLRRVKTDIRTVVQAGR